MGHFTQAVEERITFDGDELVLTLRRMQNKHLLHIAPHLAGGNAPGTNAGLLLRSAALVDASKEMLRECVVGFQGLKDKAGNSMAFSDILEEAYFLPLLDQVLGRLLQISVMTEVDAKKSAAPPPAASLGANADPTLSAAS